MRVVNNFTHFNRVKREQIFPILFDSTDWLALFYPLRFGTAVAQNWIECELTKFDVAANSRHWVSGVDLTWMINLSVESIS